MQTGISLENYVLGCTVYLQSVSIRKKKKIITVNRKMYCSAVLLYLKVLIKNTRVKIDYFAVRRLLFYQYCFEFIRRYETAVGEVCGERQTNTYLVAKFCPGIFLCIHFFV